MYIYILIFDDDNESYFIDVYKSRKLAEKEKKKIKNESYYKNCGDIDDYFQIIRRTIKKD